MVVCMGFITSYSERAVLYLGTELCHTEEEHQVFCLALLQDIRSAEYKRSIM